MMWIGALVALALALGLGALWGRRSGPNAERLRELEQEGEARRKETERLRDELAAAREEAERQRRELEGYRGRVAEHFAGTSEALRELTLQYRAVFGHLSKGAAELCPERFEEIESGLGLGALGSGSEAGAGDQGEPGSPPPREGPADDAGGERRTGAGPGEGGAAR